MQLGQRWERLLVAAYSRTPERPRRAVMRLTTPGHRVGVLVLLRRPDGRVLLVDQPYLPGWSLPGGNLKRGEDPASGAVRELREELGIRVPVPEPVHAHLRTSDRWVTFVVSCDVDDLTADSARPRSEEIATLGWFPPDALPPLSTEAAAPLRLALEAAGT